MGWFDGASSSTKSSSGGAFVRRRGSPTRSTKGHSSSSHHKGYTSTHHGRHSAPSIFSLGRGTTGRSSSPSVFSTFSSSSRRARPREGFVQRMIHSIKKLFRDIVRYARKHPVKVFFLVILPLLTSGVLVKLLAMVGLRLPHGVASALGGAGGGARGFGGMEGAMGGVGGGKGLSESVSGLVSLAKMFA
ncbi:uncharacterized protein N7473_000583 [Penicillium subrubescens]|uniref:Uncharacterized protein n=1 Tax=Penicillium subrubescens TaxID=1316194 RepID=A0A1Q5U7U1_9EURO|nr:uncharacterized protein N7473_000583 [Penicillium subrubescens]KAJ5911280.1 hypothetical protein N7473_000583 [Penicillium subrubescens]OKP08555.1 hypothetical protein PENSUB_5542 [Penicillium subrubescens]